MPQDLSQFITLKQAMRSLPQPRHLATGYRWALRGLDNGVHLTFAEQCAAATSDIDLEFLAAQLGVSLASLSCLEVGWSPQYRAWTIPERRPDGWIIGVQLRSPEGQKWMVSGSHRG